MRFMKLKNCAPKQTSGCPVRTIRARGGISRGRIFGRLRRWNAEFVARIARGGAQICFLLPVDAHVSVVLGANGALASGQLTDQCISKIRHPRTGLSMQTTASAHARTTRSAPHAAPLAELRRATPTAALRTRIRHPMANSKL